jgi:hypothetical protein
MARMSFQISDELRAFLRQVVVRIDWSEDGNSLVGPDAFADECCSGGRADGDVYEFAYLGRDGESRWKLALREQQIRDIVGGQLTEIDADREDIAQRTQRGDALIVWGEYADDGMRVRTQRELAIALDALHAAAAEPDAAKSLRLWSTADDQLFAVIYGEQCAIYVVQYRDGYGTSAGDPTRTETFAITDHDAGMLVVPWADCVPWPVARSALLGFAETGELGDEVGLDGRIPGALLILGDTTRESELATRGTPNADPARTSLLRVNPFARWARRLIDALRGLELIELLDLRLDAVTLSLAAILAAHGEDALDSLRIAERLTNEIGAAKGVDRMFATPGDLQVALRRTREG